MSHVMWDMISCELGAVALVCRGDCLIRVCFEGSPEDVSARVTGLYPDAKRASQPLLREGLEQLAEYFLGKRRCFTMPLANEALSGFACKVQETLLAVPYGSVVSYGELAKRAGYPGAARAVGGVMSSNPFPLIVPCHRVVNADGRIGRYSAAHGTRTKNWLIEFENRLSCA